MGMYVFNRISSVNWLFMSLSMSISRSNNGILGIDLDGNFSIFPVATSRNVYPSFYLLSSVAYSKGDGASLSPFRIE